MHNADIARVLGLTRNDVQRTAQRAIRRLWLAQVSLDRARTLNIRRASGQSRHLTDAEIDAALVAAGGNKTRAAAALGMSRQGINGRLRKRQP